MPSEFHHEYLVCLPLPLAQLYSRAYNAKDSRSRHDNAFYLFEVLVKLIAAPLVAAYIYGVRRDVPRVASLDRLLVQLALPSLGQWVSIVRELARHFGEDFESTRHPLGHVWGQLTRRHRDQLGLLGLYQRIKNGPDGERANEQSCTVLQIFEALVQYRNAVIGHGAGRLESFYEKHMGPLLFPAVNDILSADVLSPFGPLGPPGTRLVYLCSKPQAVSAEAMQIELWDLIGMTGVTAPPLQISWEAAREFTSPGVAVLWPEQPVPLRLDPLLMCREREIDQVPEVLFLNRARNARQVEYLSYTTGSTERDETMAPAMARLLSLITDRTITEEGLAALGEQSIAETPSVEALWEPQPEPLHQLGDYELLAEIGRGGMGVVYLARQLSLGRIVALKVLPNDLALDAVALARFQREIRALANCDHPNVVKVLTSGTLPDGRPYYTMEYVPGADLEQVWRELAGQAGQDEASHLGNSVFVRAVISASGKRRQETEARYTSSASSGTHPSATSTSQSTANTAAVSQEAEISVPRLPLPPLPPLPSAEDDPGGYVRRVVTLMRDTALALQSVHDQQIIHRDVKPANLLLTPDSSRVVVMDFGLAKGPETTLAASRQGGLLGTMRYAAPEQLAAANLKVGPAADVRGLGVTMWELLTRRRLFADAQDEKQLAMMIHEMDVPRLRTIDPSFDRDLDAIVARATERRTTDRIPTAGQLAEYLQLYLDGQPLPIRPPSRIELFRRWARRRKGTVAAGCAAAVLLLAAAAGVWYWDAYHRVQVQYYSNFIKRWGAPEGIGRVTSNELKHRFTTFRFTRQGRLGPVQRVEMVNNTGNPFVSILDIHKLATYLGGSDLDILTLGRQECCWEFKPNLDDKKRVGAEVAIDPAGRPVYEFRYTADDVGGYLVRGIVRPRTGSGAAHVQFRRLTEGPQKGLDQELIFTDRDGHPKPDSRGIYRVRRVFDPRGLVVQETYHDSDGTPMRLTENYARVDWEYNDRGQLIQATYYDEQGRLTRHQEGYARQTYQYDQWGNAIAVANFNEADNLVDTTEGYARMTVEHDLRHRVLTGTHFDARDNLTTQTYGLPGSKWRLQFDDRGRWHQLDIFAKQGVSIYAIHGWGGIKFQYNDRGDVVAIVTIDDKGNPVQGPEGYSKKTLERDERGNIVELRTFDVEGKPVLNEQGVYRAVMKYDSHDNVIETAFFDATDQPMFNEDGYARLQKEYDERGNVSREAYYDTEGRLTQQKDGGHTVLNKYDERGKLAEIIYTDADGNPILHKDGYARVKQKHDERGNLIEWACFGADGKPAVDRNSTHKYIARYDEQRREIERTYFGPDGKPTRHAEGYARYTKTYRSPDNVIEWAYFDIDGKPMRLSGGYARWRQKFDSRGEVIEEVYLDTEGQPTLHDNGFARLSRQYDEKGKLTEEAYFDATGKPTRQKNGYAKLMQKYDKHGNLIEAAYFYETGELTQPKNRYAKVIQKYNEQKKLIEAVVFLSPSEIDENGVTSLQAYFDEHENITEQLHFNKAGQLTRNKNGYARVKKKYNNQGWLIEERYFDEEGRSTRNQAEYAVVKQKYDAQGHIIEQAFFDELEQLTPNKDGYAVVKQKYDAQGHVIERAFFDAAGQPTRNNDGFAKRIAKYNERGDLIEDAYFNEAGQLTQISQGYAKMTARHDERGAMQACSYWDAQGRLVEPKPQLVVNQVLDNSQAQRLGLQVGDVITAYNQMPMHTWCEFRVAVDAPGDGLRTLTVVRSGQTLTFQVQPGKIGAGLTEVAATTTTDASGKSATP